MVKITLVTQATAISQFTALEFHLRLAQDHGDLGFLCRIAVPSGITIALASHQPKEQGDTSRKVNEGSISKKRHAISIAKFSIFRPPLGLKHKIREQEPTEPRSDGCHLYPVALPNQIPNLSKLALPQDLHLYLHKDAYSDLVVARPKDWDLFLVLDLP